MRLKLKKFEVSAGRPIAFLNEEDAKDLDVSPGDRVQVFHERKNVICTVDILDDFLSRGEISISLDVKSFIKARVGNTLEVKLAARPLSASFIAKKMNAKTLSKQEIYTIISDIVTNSLTEAEIAQFIVAVYRNGMSNKETVFLTEAMYRTGTVLKWHVKDVVDKHCIGGIAGNRTTPIVVSICAAGGIVMPKTSSRAITSAAGTADTIETIAQVNFPASTLKKIVEQTGACLAWGGSLGLAPADDKLIKIERILKIDPESQLLASILSKKLAVGSNHVLIDIPYGIGAKVSKAEANHLSERFIWLGKQFKLKVKVIPTNGSEPIGNGIGPTLEMLDVLKVLKRDNPPKDLENKSVMLAGIIFEMMNKAKKGQGEKLARDILDSGKAYKKFEEIIYAQGRINGHLKPAKFFHPIKSESSGKVVHIDNKSINFVASVLGCPSDKSAGLYIYKHVKDKVARGEEIVRLYAESKEKLKEGIDTFNKLKPFFISK